MKRITAFLVTFAAAVVFGGIMSFAPVNAVTVLPSDKTILRNGYTFLGLEGKYITQIQESLDLINKIRLEACTEGVKNPESGLPLTAEDYVPIQWSADLEYIARIRAAEASLTMDHARTNGEWIWFESPGGVSSCAEVIAWNWGETMTEGIDQWYEEKYDWVNNTGGVTGHYTSMISPDHRYVGLGTFCSDYTYYRNTTAGEFSRSTRNLDTSRGSSTGTVIQALEVKDEYISAYALSGSDSLQITASVTFTDYWGGSLTTEGLTVVGASLEKTEWKSSNEKIVTVSNGNLTRLSCGSATITATLPNKTAVKKEVFYDHSYKTVSDIPATCKEEGRTDKKCSVCGDTITEMKPKTNDHTFEVTSTTPATCKEEGKIEKKCKVCGLTVTEAIPKTNDHTYEVISTVSATCKEEGRKEKRCKVCGDTVTEIIPKTDQHTFGQWETTVKPTESTEGVETRTCEICGATETRTVSFTESDNKETTSVNEGAATQPLENGTESAETALGEQASDENSENPPSEDGSSGSPSNGDTDNNSPTEGSGGASDDISDNDGSSDSPIVLIAIIAGVAVAGGAAVLIVRFGKGKAKK